MTETEMITKENTVMRLPELTLIECAGLKTAGQLMLDQIAKNAVRPAEKRMHQALVRAIAKLDWGYLVSKESENQNAG